MSYSQQNEEQFILSCFEPEYVGTFLDIGAGHPTKFSNTRALIEQGWFGMLVEGSPFMMSELVRIYGGNPKIILANLVVVAETDEATSFWLNQELTSSVNEIQAKKWPNPCYEMLVNPCPVRRLFDIYKEQFSKCDFLNLDIEGQSVAVLNVLRRYLNYDAVCVEHDGQTGLVLRDHTDFDVVHENNTNIILKRKK